MQSGGSFDVDFEVTAPSGKIVTEGTKERQGDFVFTGNEIGDYSFCFNNEMSTVTDKFVDFEIAVSNPCILLERIFLQAQTKNSADNRACRLRMKPESIFPPRREPPPNKPLPSRSPSSRFRARCPPYHETKSTSAHVRTATSAPSGALRRGLSTSAWSNPGSSSAWVLSRYLSSGFSSRAQGRATYKS